MPVLHLPESVLGDLRELRALLQGMNEKLDVQARAAAAQGDTLARVELALTKSDQTQNLIIQSLARIEQTQAIQGEAIDRLESTQAEQSALLDEIATLVGDNNTAVAFKMTFTPSTPLRSTKNG